MPSLEDTVKRVVIVGGGTSGWMAAAALSKELGSHCKIVLIESKDIATVGVGEATIPHIRAFHQWIDVDEREFMQSTGATFKLGIQFVDWHQRGKSYVHPFGELGKNFDSVPFSYHWVKANLAGNAEPLDRYSMASMLALENRFEKPDLRNRHALPVHDYAYHFDAGRYADFLAEHSKRHGVNHVVGTVQAVSRSEKNGFIENVQLTDGRIIEGDLVLDCSGSSGLLISNSFGVDFEDWGDYLMCDSALAVSCEHSTDNITPYTKSIAKTAGWQWQIPLQHRIGNGYVYSSHYIDDLQAEEELLNGLESPASGHIKKIKFKTGRRNAHWVKNCVALGLASGFLEPLESTSLHFTQMAIRDLVTYFPSKRMPDHAIKRFNNAVNKRYESARDFLVLHYVANNNDMSGFWRDCRNMEIPDTLQSTIESFRSSGGYFPDFDTEVFSQASWFVVLVGQGVSPGSCLPMLNLKSDVGAQAALSKIAQAIRAKAGFSPCHSDYLNQMLYSKNNSL